MPLKKNSIWIGFEEMKILEFHPFLGVIINMSMSEKPKLQDYFSNDPLFYQPFFKNIFSRKRFQQIYWGYHIQMAGESRIEANQELFSHLKKNFKEYYTPLKELLLDE